MDWISDTIRRLATASGIDAGSLLLDATTAQQLLDLAGFAAHESGDRTNAPLLCFVLGRATALGASLEELDEALRGVERE
jgi:Domain of unknown function (DUF6457)